ncbi:hypothetical protein U1Q18_014888, partial [Sarracenia purpurea var. burkii]
SIGKGRVLRKEQEGVISGDSRGDNGGESQTQGVGPLQSSRREAKVALGHIVGSPAEPVEKSVAKGPDPVDKKFTRTPVLPNRVSENHPTSRAPNWKRRAREAKSDLPIAPCDADRKKRKMGDEEGRGDDDEMEQATGQKRSKTGKREEVISPKSGSVEHLRVSDLISKEQARWNSQKIQQILPFDAEIIEGIPLSYLAIEDELVWHFTKDGRYSVRSGYHLEQSNKLTGEGGSEPSPLGRIIIEMKK